MALVSSVGLQRTRVRTVADVESRLQLVQPGGIRAAAGERNYLGFTVAFGHPEQVGGR
jgi:hypothetical protein